VSRTTKTLAQPFLEDGSQWGVSRSAFRRMRKAEKRDLMLQWFEQNFEDPAERTPYESAEGGYIWIWGGPFDAREELFSKFGGIASESLIEEVALEVEKGGVVLWAPTPQRDDYDDYEPSSEPPTLDVFLDEPSDAYGKPQERQLRARARKALDELQRILDAPVPIGIGHNRPPEILEEPDEIKELRPALAELRTELAKLNPAIEAVKRWAAPLRRALIASAIWAAQKIDKAVDAGVKAMGVAIIARYSESLRNAFDAVINWLDIAARHLF